MVSHAERRAVLEPVRQFGSAHSTVGQVRHLLSLVDAIWELADALTPMEYGIVEG
jgi:hypothetical protein